jgi:ABC-type antimicrobial peptide transport system permease subunit
MIAVIHQINPEIATSNAATMNELIGDSQPAYIHRASTLLVGGFAVLAMVLSVVGPYGVIAYSVSQRSREIGVRMAVGAQRASVYCLILREAGTLVAFGIVMGLFCSTAATTLVRKFLFGIQPWDPTRCRWVACQLCSCPPCSFGQSDRSFTGRMRSRQLMKIVLMLDGLRNGRDEMMRPGL